MKKIFQDAVDKNVAAVMLFADASKDIFYDEAHKEPVPAEDCVNLFIKGVVCEYNDVLYKALSCSDAGVINFGFPV